jgi:hypothetical protein
MPQEKQTTAVSQTILKMQEAKDNFPNIGFDEEFIRGFNKAFQMAIFISQKVGLPIERQQIEDAFNTKRGFEISSDPVKAFKTSEQYFNENFTQQQ